MSTIALIVEILVIGIQAGTTVLLWAVGMLGYGVLHKPLSLLDAHGGSWQWIPILAVVAVAACYTLGILVDRISMILFYELRVRLRAPFRWLERRVKEPTRADEVLVRVLKDEKELTPFLNDFRSRLRIARATVFHLILICLAFFRSPHLHVLLPRRPGALLFVELLGSVLALAILLGWAILQVTDEERLRQVEELRLGKR
jgi:hypothetical protein